jgi:hypothetical protein
MDYDLSQPPPSLTTKERTPTKSANVDDDDRTNEELSQRQQQQNEYEHIQPLSTSPIASDGNVQEEDVLVEEDVTPFYMNSGEFMVTCRTTSYSSYRR